MPTLKAGQPCEVEAVDVLAKQAESKCVQLENCMAREYEREKPDQQDCIIHGERMEQELLDDCDAQDMLRRHQPPESNHSSTSSSEPAATTRSTTGVEILATQ